jgi:hypothetical protein
MYAVVNHMKLSRPLDDNIVGRMNSELMSDLVKLPREVPGPRLSGGVKGGRRPSRSDAKRP